MTDKTFSLSRRKALAGLGSIGAATALGGLGTVAQFTDEEDVDVTFTTGEIDGALAYSATYNGTRFKEMGEEGDLGDHPHVIDGDGGGPGVGFTLDDVKPGDYGSILFEIEVGSNPAWLTNCLGIGGSVTDIEYPNGIDPEDSPGEIYGDLLGTVVGNGSGDWSQGNLGDLLMFIPFYDEDDTSSFFDQDGPDTLDPASRYGVGAPGGFWSNEQEQLNPLAFNQALANSSVGTALWPDENAVELLPEDGLECADGCYLLHGQMADLSGGESSDNTPEEAAAPLQPGSTMYFGYDWHLPWEVGNYAQSATLDFNIGFSFVQERHSAGSEFPNMYEYDPVDV